MNIIIDTNVLFIACALSQPPSIIWSDDKPLKGQHQVMVLNTSEVKEIMGLY